MAHDAVAEQGCPVSKIAKDFDALDLADPFPFYRRARAEEPVFHDPNTNYWVVSRYDDVKAVFENWQGFSSEIAQQPLKPLCPAAKTVMTMWRPGRNGLFDRDTESFRKGCLTKGYAI